MINPLIKERIEYNTLLALNYDRLANETKRNYFNFIRRKRKRKKNKSRFRFGDTASPELRSKLNELESLPYKERIYSKKIRHVIVDTRNEDRRNGRDKSVFISKFPD